MTVPYPLVLLLLAVVLVLFTAAAWEYGRGLDQRAALAERGGRGYDDRRGPSRLDRFDARLRRTPFGRRLARRIAAAGLRARVGTVVLAGGGGGAALLAVLGVFVSFALGLIVAGVAAGAGLVYLQRQEDRRREEFVAQLPELARVLGNATAAGLSLRTAVAMAADELDEPARTELNRTAEALRLGQGFEDAMYELRDRLPSRELAVLVGTLVVSARAGGSLITSLRSISTTLEQRKETRREVRTILGQSLAVGYTITGMGACLLLALPLVSPGVMTKMTGSVAGLAVLAVVIALFAVALVLFRRVTRIDV
ncbi:type II secretion system F family protein [Actinomadura atramentaria]|uniref:type II secretion system F family protein n=1 Tax=Actinomadura atramentaria TaxID=1990 RepID=UPI00037B998B|nr:type II secretion system F family protein [Actinomadura atramentaria]